MNTTFFSSTFSLANHAPVGIRWFTIAALAFLFLPLNLLPPNATAQEPKLPEVDSPAKVPPGGTALVKAADGKMNYFLRVPKTYNPKYGARLIVFLHGSNMNGLAYLRSFEAKHWCDGDILCCPNGEKGTDPYGRNNFGFQSGPLVAEVTRTLQKTFKTPITYVGGHSQGAFLTYNVTLNHPDLYHGAFPMAGDCWMQNEPNLWEDKPEILERQKQIAIAVIHGQADPVVKFSQGEHAYDCFRAMGWTRLRFFAPEKLDHKFMLAPVGEAIEWLDAMNGINEKRTLARAAQWSKEGEWGWVWHAANSSKRRAPAIRKLAEAAAEKAATTIATELKGEPADWVPKWVEFWRVHGETDAAKSLVADYLKQRDQQRAAAARLFNKSQVLFRSDKRDDAFEALEQLRDEGAYTYHAYFACKWLSERQAEE